MGEYVNEKRNSEYNNNIKKINNLKIKYTEYFQYRINRKCIIYVGKSNDNKYYVIEIENESIRESEFNMKYINMLTEISHIDFEKNIKENAVSYYKRLVEKNENSLKELSKKRKEILSLNFDYII